MTLPTLALTNATLRRDEGEDLMGRVQRFDHGRIDAVERTPQGGLRIPAALTRTGVLTYADTTGKTWNELRPEDEVFSKDSLATLRGSPVTELHPDHMVTAESWKNDAVGHASDDVRRDGAFVTATVVVQDAGTVQKVDSKDLHELSCGYDCEIDPTPGTHDGVHYDAIQRKIRYNHVALLPVGTGRAGRDVALRLDGAAIEVRTQGTPTATQQQTLPLIAEKPAAEKVMRADAREESTTMDPILIKVGKREFKLDAAAPPTAAQVAPVQAAIDQSASDFSAQFEAVKAALTDALTKVATLEVKIAAEEAAEAGKAAPVVTEDMVPEDVLDAAIVKRAAVVELAKTLKCDEAQLKGKTSEIKRAVIAKAFPSVKLDALDAKVIETLFAAAKDAKPAEVRNDALADAHRIAAGDGGARTDADLDPVELMAKQREEQRLNSMKGAR